MRLDPALAAILRAEGALTAPRLAEMPVASALAALRAPKPPALPPPDATAFVEDRDITGPDGNLIPVRVYQPPGPGPFPLLLHFHGGGWVGGGIGNDDRRCHLTSVRAGAVIVSVAYRLAPEHQFPAGLEDAYAALGWAAANPTALHADPDRIALGGASAGGNIAAACALLSLRRGGPRPRCLVLSYPVCDTSLSQPSHRDNAEAPLLTTAMMAWFITQYVPPGADRANPLVALLNTPDFSVFPPALVITAGCDPLRDEGAAFAASLQTAGVPAIHSNYEGMVHGFITRAPDHPQSHAAMAEIVNFLNQYL